jgi:hypothetical protein
MRRRDFLAEIGRGAAALGGAALAAEAFAGPLGPQHTRRRPRRRPVTRPENPKLARIGISSWSFHNLFASTRDRNAAAAENLVLLDFPEMIADRYQVHHLEMVAPHFASTEPAYLRELRSKLAAAHSRLVNIPVDIEELWREGGLSDPSGSVRNAAIAAAKKWIDVAKTVGAQSVRCDPGKMNLNDLTLTIDSYKKLAAYGRSKGIYVLIENHGEIGSTHPEVLIALFKGVNSSFLGSLPDFGNFPDEATRLRGLPMLFPYAKTVCHAKGLEFDANGNETRFNFARCVEISRQAHFRGIYSIEYEGAGDPYEGVRSVVNELVRDL